ncbi:MAG: DUF952 domain-containing protein [Chloroflexota bacterium]|nr:MAG: hypothetical protein KatS3mg047_1143 [Bellilinea sp.]
MRSEQFSEMIYHIAESQAWFNAIESGSYYADSLSSEGFIHCSTREQVMEVAERLFSKRTDVVVLEIEQTNLPIEVKYETAPNGKSYPHVYGEIPLEAVRRVFIIDWTNRSLEVRSA